ncbi:MAG: menaquinone biosynthesis protein [Bacteroidota bacterium]
MRIGNVSYLNSFPFRFGLKSSCDDEINTYVPSEIASRLEDGFIDIGLVPLASFLQHKNWHIISDYCIGAEGAVKTVLLISKKPIHKIQSICYDTDSRSSNMLTKVLAANYWKITPFEANVNDADARVMIGDKAFADYSDAYPYTFDLAQEWFDFQKLPFVFAVWVSNKELMPVDLKRINEMMKFGVNHIEESLNYFSENLPVPPNEALSYLKDNISFLLDSNKRLAIKQFEELASNSGLI